MSLTKDDITKAVGIGMEDGLRIQEDPCSCTMQPSPKAPLNLPEGSVRALITLIIILAGCIATVVWKDVPGALGVAFGTVITSYFNVRGSQSK